METKRLLNSFSRVKAITAITLFVLFASAMTNSLSAQTYTHIWKGGTGDWATLSNWYDGTGSAQAAALPVAGSVVKIITGTCTINSGTTALGHVFIGNTDQSLSNIFKKLYFS